MRNRQFVTVTIGLVITIILAGALLGYALHLRNRDSQPPTPRPFGVPSNLSTSVVNLMSLSPIPHHLAPNFTFVDQLGHTISLSGLRGKNVVLNFMDPHCKDICPIVSQELIIANHELGASAKNTVFLAINVNQYNLTVADVNTFSNEHRLNTIPTWHFLTGSYASLAKVWAEYGVQVLAPTATADVQHTSATYFINTRGVEQYFAAPQVDHTTKGVSYLPGTDLLAWGKGIAQVVKDLNG